MMNFRVYQEFYGSLKAAKCENLIQKVPSLCMGKEQFAHFLSELSAQGIDHLWVIQYPDWQGGCRQVLKTYLPDLQDFEYISWEGDLSKALKDRNKVFMEEYFPPHESREYYFNSLEELILEGFKD